MKRFLLISIVSFFKPSFADVLIHDLTWSFGRDTVYWPGQLPFNFTREETVSADVYTMFLTTLCLLLALSSKVTSLEKSVDLSWDFGSNTVYISGMRKFAFEKEIESSSDRGYWYSVKEFCAAEHGGTHFDAPYHFYQEGIKVSEIPAQKLFAKGALINLTAEAEEQGRNARLTVKHLEDWEAKNGNFEIGSVLLVQFGRSK
ncbi:hypothetical protein HUJ05_010550 [Dendroctonus ponderosae]|nr:hypothetical protein HUJ05_010550 [Dendroctonus ponderosae]KAH1025943.1 hypothetical protein HUJ05_010550 [Dendroctonus ponderosae]KAH1025944.1 hypothetical protein HUJ05_010550 [Dendroctonus ponderosae]